MSGLSTAQRIVGAPVADREKDDFYPTPAEATEALLRVESFDGPIWEPACGDGAISRILEAAGHSVVSTDLVDRGYGEPRVDFLMERRSMAPNIITNPPFKLMLPFVHKAIELSSRKVAIIGRIQLLEGKERARMFATTPFCRAWVFTWRLPFLRGGNEIRGTSMLAYCWFIWEHGYTGKPTLGWLT